MDVYDIKRELNLIYYGYDEKDNAFLTTMDTSMTIREFTKILEKLEEYKITYKIKNMSYIKVNV